MLGTLLQSIVTSVSELDHVITASNQLEVVVCMDGSTDGSKKLLDNLKSNFPVQLDYIWQQNAGLAAARNSLVHSASNSLIWFVDDDMVVSAAALSSHLMFDRSVAEILVGPCNVDSDSSIYGFYNSRWSQIEKQGGQVTNPQQMSFANTSGSKHLFEKHPFSPEFTCYGFEDYELAIRIIAAGCSIKFDRSAGITHTYERSTKKYIKNIRDEGVNRVKLSRLHPVAGSFALDLDTNGYRRVIAHAVNRNWYRPLYIGAMISIFFSKVFTGRVRQRIKNISHVMALYSGVAKEGGKLTTPSRKK